MRSTLIVCILSALSLAAATPTRRATCTPNFEGTSVSVHDGLLEWSAATATAGTLIKAVSTSTNPPGRLYRFEQTGSVPATYVVKDVRATANNIVASISFADNTLKLSTLVNGNPDPNSQIFSINCDTCHSGASSAGHGFSVASGCEIASASTGKCLQLASTASGTTLFSATCTIGNVQKFNFITA